jgi:rhodanese-related sulfurtransferase
LLLIVLLAAVLLALVAVRLLTGGGFETVEPVRAAELLRDRAVLLLDVRTRGEFRFGRIPGARLIPMAELEAAMATLPADRPLVVYCASGLRSRMAARRLSGRKGGRVFNLAGGIAAWQRAGLPVEK